ncbi:MAG TPA: response regulator transcription factor [Kofleriaceae bacterium]|jgi:DNA-binding NarL/FixJ family response regulator|nr:response regulator transcription factor [Kofleriaceae bacterium]
MHRHRLILIEDHDLVRAALRMLLEHLANVEVVGEGADGNDALRLIASLRPDLALMDLAMPGLSGFEATRRAAKRFPKTKVLILSMHSDRGYVRQAIGAGASGYLLKTAGVDEMKLAIAAVLRGDTWLSPTIASAMIDDTVRGLRSRAASARADALTTRQREVLQLIAEGNTTREIALSLRISVKTVETHRAQIMERLDIDNLAGLVRYAIRAGIVPAAS